MDDQVRCSAVGSLLNLKYTRKLGALLLSAIVETSPNLNKVYISNAEAARLGKPGRRAVLPAFVRSVSSLFPPGMISAYSFTRTIASAATRA
jgi:hypothetical protein